MRAAILGMALAALAISSNPALACGTERWPAKTATDQDAGKIAGYSVSTIAALGTIAPPAQRPRNARIAPIETQIVAVSGYMTVIKPENDEDYHIVIADPANPAATMIVEAPATHCALGSRFAAYMAGARQSIDGFFGGPTTRRQTVNIPVTVIGVPFFDRIHGQEGVAPNGIELHPILMVLFP